MVSQYNESSQDSAPSRYRTSSFPLFSPTFFGEDASGRDGIEDRASVSLLKGTSPSRYRTSSFPLFSPSFWGEPTAVDSEKEPKLDITDHVPIAHEGPKMSQIHQPIKDEKVPTLTSDVIDGKSIADLEQKKLNKMITDIGRSKDSVNKYRGSVPPLVKARQKSLPPIGKRSDSHVTSRHKPVPPIDKQQKQAKPKTADLCDVSKKPAKKWKSVPLPDIDGARNKPRFQGAPYEAKPFKLLPPIATKSGEKKTSLANDGETQKKGAIVRHTKKTAQMEERAKAMREAEKKATVDKPKTAKPSMASHHLVADPKPRSTTTSFTATDLPLKEKATRKDDKLARGSSSSKSSKSSQSGLRRSRRDRRSRSTGSHSSSRSSRSSKSSLESASSERSSRCTSSSNSVSVRSASTRCNSPHDIKKSARLRSAGSRTYSSDGDFASVKGAPSRESCSTPVSARPATTPDRDKSAPKEGKSLSSSACHSRVSSVTQRKIDARNESASSCRSGTNDRPNTAAGRPTSGITRPKTATVSSTIAPVPPTTASARPTSASVHPHAKPARVPTPPVKPRAESSRPSTASGRRTHAPVRPTTASVRPATAQQCPMKAPLHPTTASLRPKTAPPRPTTPQQGPTTALVRPTTAPLRPKTAMPPPTTAPMSPSSASPRPFTAPVHRSVESARPVTATNGFLRASSSRPSSGSSRRSNVPDRVTSSRQSSASSRHSGASSRQSVALSRQSATQSRQSGASSRQSVTTPRQSVTPTGNSVTPSRQSGAPSRQSATSSRQSVTTPRQNVIPTGKSATPSRHSVASSRQSTASSRKSTTPVLPPISEKVKKASPVQTASMASVHSATSLRSDRASSRISTVRAKRSCTELFY